MTRNLRLVVSHARDKMTAWVNRRRAASRIRRNSLGRGSSGRGPFAFETR